MYKTEISLPNRRFHGNTSLLVLARSTAGWLLFSTIVGLIRPMDDSKSVRRHKRCQKPKPILRNRNIFSYFFKFYKHRVYCVDVELILSTVIVQQVAGDNLHTTL